MSATKHDQEISDADRAEMRAKLVALRAPAPVSAADWRDTIRALVLAECKAAILRSMRDIYVEGEIETIVIRGKISA